MSKRILTQKRETIYEIILNRSEKQNAINLEMIEQLESAVIEANSMSDIRTIFIRGEGKVFSSGIDPSQLVNLEDKYGSAWKQRSRAVTADAQAVFNRLESLELPTVCLIHGYCLGMAMELALACDIRIAAQKSILGLPETRLGLIPDVGGTTRLTRLVGPARAKELIFTGRQFDASVAEQWGIVNYVVPESKLQTKGEELASEISQAAPLAVGVAKRVIDGLADIDRGLMLESWGQNQLFNTEDFLEGMHSFMRRKPQFKGK